MIVTVTAVRTVVCDEWVNCSIDFEIDTDVVPDMFFNLERDDLCRQILAHPVFKEYERNNSMRTVTAGQDGSYTEIKVQKPVFIPRRYADFCDWYMYVKDGKVYGWIAGSDR